MGRFGLNKPAQDFIRKEETALGQTRPPGGFLEETLLFPRDVVLRKSRVGRVLDPVVDLPRQHTLGKPQAEHDALTGLLPRAEKMVRGERPDSRGEISDVARQRGDDRAAPRQRLPTFYAQVFPPDSVLALTLVYSRPHPSVV